MKTKVIIPILLLILLSTSVLSAVEDTAILTQINERLERSKAETIKAVRDANNQTIGAIGESMDSNFEVLDGRIQDFLKASKRDIAVIMVVTFLSGFAISQIIRLRVEKARRKGLVKRGIELEIAVEKMTLQAQELAEKVSKLKALDETYSKELKSMSKKPPFITIQAILLAVITFIIGVGVAYLLLGVRVGG